MTHALIPGHILQRSFSSHAPVIPERYTQVLNTWAACPAGRGSDIHNEHGLIMADTIKVEGNQALCPAGRPSDLHSDLYF